MASRRPDRLRIPLGSRGRLSYERRVHLTLLLFAALVLLASALFLLQIHLSTATRLGILAVAALMLWWMESVLVARLLRPLQKCIGRHSSGRLLAPRAWGPSRRFAGRPRH
jgi:hypothetical protein